MNLKHSLIQKLLTMAKKFKTNVHEFRIGYIPGSIFKNLQILVFRGKTSEKGVYFKLCVYVDGMRIKQTETIITEQVYRQNFQSHFDSSILFYNALELVGFDKLVFGSLTTN